MAAISLLDEQNQYFLSVVHAATIENPTVRRSDWFGCEKIFFRGGICERTITRGYESPASPIYEIPDLQVLEETKSLPVVDGRSANFKYYAGTPITTTQGLNVGALFIFKKNYLSQPLSSTKRKFIIETALSATEHLAQTIGAIENTRSLAFNASISSLPDYDKPGSASHVADVMNSIGNVESLKSELYGTAAHLLLQTLDLEHVVIQKVLRKGELLGTSAKTSTESILAEYHDPSAGPSQPVPQQLVEQLLRSWPSGVILQLASADQDDFFIPSVQQDSNAREHIQIALGDYCPGIQQCIFMPLRDYFHDRHTAVIFGWTRGFNRVYAGSTDLPSVASFGTALMTQLRRLETLALTRKQSDFLGSVSHEMRSPLHGILACIEHLRTTDCSAQQLDLLESAAACGLQLNNNIDNILQISQIGVSSPTTRTSKQSLLRSDADMTSQSHGAQRHPSTNTLLHHITSLVDETMRLHECITMPLQIVDHDMNLVPTRMAHTLVTLDAPLEADISIVYCPALDAIVKNLCVSHSRSERD
jgi:signal transduction histidine kinase